MKKWQATGLSVRNNACTASNLSPEAPDLPYFDFGMQTTNQTSAVQFPKVIAFIFCSLVVLMLACNSVHSDEPTKEQIEFFEKRIRPVLTDHCFECHSSEKQESDLRLDSRKFILSGGASGPAANIDDPESSLILKVLRYDGDVEMPPDQKLDDEVLEDVRKWIEMKMPWPKEKKGTGETNSSLSMEQKLDSHRKDHWAFQPLKGYAVPKLTHDSWSKNRIDKLIKKKLVEKDLKPSPEANRFELTRRLYLVLLGIPPTYAEAQKILSDSSSDWYEKLVDQLLASPRYGERWGRHWLDVARYADTRGYSFQRDRNYPHAYTYRDYVINSWNDDKPFNQFVLEQLAADQLELKENLRPLAGLGFLTVGRKFNDVHDDIDDKIDVVFRGLQGLTVACARCHDHKYDAIPTEDYYSLYGVFASSQEGALPYIGMRHEVEAYQEKKAAAEAANNQLQQFLNQQRSIIVDQARNNSAFYLAIALGIKEEIAREKILGPPAQKPFRYIPKISRSWKDYLRRQATDNHPVWSPWKALSAFKDDNTFEAQSKSLIANWEKSNKKINPLLFAQLKSQTPKSRLELAKLYGRILTDVYNAWKKAGSNDQGLANLSSEQQQIGIALFTDQTPTEIKTENIKAYLAGSLKFQYDQLNGEAKAQRESLPPELDRAMVVTDKPSPVEPVVFIRGQAGRRGKQVPRQFIQVLSAADQKAFTNGAGRLDMARRITSPNNPLTARVLANRIWMRLMGSSLVATPSDFGTRCPEPIQRDVLDHLARKLLDSDWSIKTVQRSILLSATFRQSSRFRENGDKADTANTLYWKYNRQRLEFEPLRDSMLYVSSELDLSMGGKSVEITKPPFAKRRGVYGYIDRQDLPNLLRAFDFASPDQSSAQRTKTTVPQQMLFLMNSPFVLERANKIASRISDDAEDVNKIKRLYQTVLSRDPNATELAVTTKYIRQESGNSGRWKNLAQILLQSNEFSFVD